MLEFLITFVVLWIIVWPILTLLHELGHALAALVFTNGPVRIELGKDTPECSIRIARLTLVLRLATGFVGKYWITNRPGKRWQYVTICLAGPVVSLISAGVAFSLIYSATAWPHWVRTLLVWTVSFALVQFAVTIIPFRYPSWWHGYAGMASDGMRARQALKSTYTVA